MKKKNKNLPKSIITELILTVGLTAAVTIMRLPLLIKPETYIGENNLKNMKNILTTVIVCDVFTVGGVAAFTVFIVRSIMLTRRMFIAKMRLENGLSELIKDGELKTIPYSPKGLYTVLAAETIFLVLFYAVVIGVTVSSFLGVHSIMATDESDLDPVRVVRTIRDIEKDEDEQQIKKAVFKTPDITFKREYTTESGLESYCYLTTDDGKRLPISIKDAKDMKTEAKKLIEGRYVINVEYYENSGLLKGYYFTDSNWEAKEYKNPRVEISIDEDFVLHRPKDMSKFGDIAWVIKHDGKMLTLETGDKEVPYSIYASYYDSTDLMKHKALFDDEPGRYTAQLVKLFRYKDPETGRYDIFDTAPISDILTFEIASGGKIIQDLGDDKLEITFFEDDMSVHMPTLPKNYKQVKGLSLQVEVSGEKIMQNYSTETEVIEYQYAEDDIQKLSEYTAHYKVYVTAKDEEGNASVISNIIEFDHISQKDIEKAEEEKERDRYFSWLIDALEDDDVGAIKEKLAPSVIEHNDDRTESNIEKICSLFKGKAANREVTDIKLYDFTSNEDGSHICQGDVYISTESGKYHIKLDTCDSSDDSSKLGVLKISVTEINTDQSAFINNGEYI